MVRSRFIAGLIMLLAGVAPVFAQENNTWKVGVAKTVITPKELMWMSGYAARTKPADGKVHDLWAKALVLEGAKGGRCGLVTMDLVGIDGGLADAICSDLKKRHGLERSEIMLSVSHTHCGPVVRKNLLTMYTLDEKQQKLIIDYAQFLHGQIVDLVGAALKDMQPAQLGWGSGSTTFATNRRTNKEADVLKLRELGKLKGPVDHEVPVLCVREPGGKVRAIVFGYACHATVLSFYKWCGDYPGFAQLELEQRYPGATALFVAGCGADQNPLPRRGVEFAENYGKQLAEGVERVLQGPMNPVLPTMKNTFTRIDLPFGQLPTREKLLEDTMNKNPAIAARARMLLKDYEKNGSLKATYPYPVQTWQLGRNLTWVALGGEVVVDYSLRLKKELGHLWVSGYTNDVMAYIPSLRVLKEGGYEGDTSMIPYGQPCAWGPRIEEMIVQAVRKQVLDVTLFPSSRAPSADSELVEVRKIWDRAPHNAFTDLIRFQGRWLCVFREGQAHVAPDGALRVLTPSQGQQWESAALITSPTSDLRDAKVSVTPDGQLMLNGAEAKKGAVTHQSLAWFSSDGAKWTQRHDIGDPNFWLWRVTWHKGKAYGIGYGCGQDRSVRLYVSNDGKTFDTLVERLYDVGQPNESSLVFVDDTCYCLLRRDGQPNTGLLGSAKAPYTKWQWQDLHTRIGGPTMIRLPDGRFVAAVRLYDGKVRTSLCWVDIKGAKLTEFLTLPSGGDTGYAGLVWHDNLLWASYYSSHEGKASIYLAKVRLPADALPKPADSDESGPVEQTVGPKVTAPPEPFFERFREKDREAARVFYKKHIDAQGLSIAAGAPVADEALERTYHIVTHMLAGRPDILGVMRKIGTRLIIIGKDQVYTDMPEYRNHPNPLYQNERVRGTGGLAVTSFGEENLLNLPIDRYDDESIAVHEFCHTIDSALTTIDPGWRKRLGKIYQSAMSRGLWKNTYAASNQAEYWAEMCQSYFDCNRVNNWNHNAVGTREQLKLYDPDGYELVKTTFNLSATNDWRFQPVHKQPSVLTPPAAFKVHPYYSKFTYAREFPVLGSKQVSDEALLKVNDTIRKMFAYRHDILKAMIADEARLVVLGRHEKLSDLPEFQESAQKPGFDEARYVDYTPGLKLMVVPEENVLGLAKEPFAGKQMVVSVFAKGLYQVAGLRPVDANFDKQRSKQQYELRVKRLDIEFDQRLLKIFEEAAGQGLWKGTPAAQERALYWAAGVEAYFDAAGAGLPSHLADRPIRTREDLKTYDPALYALVDETMAYKEHVDWRAGNARP